MCTGHGGDAGRDTETRERPALHHDRWVVMQLLKRIIIALNSFTHCSALCRHAPSISQQQAWSGTAGACSLTHVLCHCWTALHTMQL